MCNAWTSHWFCLASQTLPYALVQRCDAKQQRKLVVVLCPWQAAHTAVSGGYLGVKLTCMDALGFRYNLTSNTVVRDAAIDPARAPVIEDRLLELGSVFGIEEFLSGWFKGAPFESIQRGNVEDFIAYGFYCKRTEQMTDWVCACLKQLVAV